MSLGVPSPLYILELSRPIHIDMAVKTQLYLCNIQGVNFQPEDGITGRGRNM